MLMNYSRKRISLAVIVGLFAMAVPGVAGADYEDRVVTFVNEYSSPLLYLYATNVDEEDWGDDLLGAHIIDPGWEISIDLDDKTGACQFDIRAEFEDGAISEDWDIDICGYTEVIYEITFY